MKVFKTIVFSLISFVLLSVLSPVLAQEDSATPPSSGVARPADGLVNCFDYYKFQSVKINLETDQPEYAPGDVVSLKGALVNVNNYPVVDGYVFARVAKKNVNYAVEGNDVIDEFFGLEKVAIDANANKQIFFDWQIPNTLSGGNYTISFFFSVGKKFNLAGLPFSNDITGGSVDFKIKGTHNQAIFFDRSKTKINKDLYSHMGSRPIFGATSSTTVVMQPLKNTYKVPRTVKVKYELFYWDSLDPDQDKINSKTEEVHMPANSTKELIYNFDRFEQASYYLRITATSEYDKSIVNIKFASKAERPRLVYSAVDSFPMRKGETANIFSCFYNTSGSDTTGKVLVILYDKDDNEIGRIEYGGPITFNIMGYKKQITAINDYSYLRIKAEVYDSKDALVDKYEGVYDCKDVGSPKCIEMAKPVAAPSKKKEAPTSKIVVSSAVLIVLIIAIVILMMRRRREI